MSQFARTPIAAAVAAIFSSATPVLAQQETTETLPEVKVTAPPEGQGFRTESIRGATRTDTPLRDIPQFIDIVPQQLIRSQQAMSLTDALRNVPGITYGPPRVARKPTRSSFSAAFKSLATSTWMACATSASTTAICLPSTASRC